MSDLVAVVLGGTVPHRYLIEELRTRGYTTVLIDHLDDPVAAASADIHVRASTLDENAVLEIARKYGASLVISAAVDQANVTACLVAEELGLPKPYSSQIARRIADKETMKEGLIRAGVPTARHQVITGVSTTLDLRSIRFPQIVKPVDTNGSKGITRVFRGEDIPGALSAALAVSRSNRAIIEDVNRGIEIGATFLLRETQAELIYARAKPDHTTSGVGKYLNVGPMRLGREEQSLLTSAAEAIAREFDLRNVPLLVQAHLDESTLSVIEFAARIGGGLSCRDILHQTGVDLLRASLDSYLGNPFAADSHCASSHSTAILHLYGTGGTLSAIDGVDELLASGTILEAHAHRTPGFAMSTDTLASNERVLGIVFDFSSVADLSRRINQISESIRILNTEGNDVLARHLLEATFFKDFAIGQLE